MMDWIAFATGVTIARPARTHFPACEQCGTCT